MMDQWEFEERLEQWLEGETSAQEWRQLREALETRVAQQSEEIAEGLLEPDSPEAQLRQQTLHEQLETLRGEELIAQFLEEALRTWLPKEE